MFGKTQEQIIKLFVRRKCTGIIHAKNIFGRLCKISNIGFDLGRKKGRVVESIYSAFFNFSGLYRAKFVSLLNFCC